MPTNATATVPCDVKDLLLASQGKRRVEWAFHSMPVLQAIRKQFIKTQPLDGIRITACLHITAEIANMIVTLRDGGAKVVVCPSDAAAVQDDVAACLVRDYSVPVFAIGGSTDQACVEHRRAALDHRPQVLLDDGGHLYALLSAGREEQLPDVLGAVERSGAAALALRKIMRQGALPFPVISSTQSSIRRLFDSRLGTGQSTLDAIIRATQLLIAGLTIVVAGYGSCGRGIAARARGLGSNVVITEVDPGRALEALLDGYRVAMMSEAVKGGDIIITATGSKNVLSRDHMERLKDGVILCNAGHVNSEIEVDTLAKMANSRREVKEFVEEFKMKDGRRVNLLCGGRQINVAAAGGHPASVQDVGCAADALSVEYLVANHQTLERQVYPVPELLDRQVGRMKLDTMAVAIDKLTFEQEEFLAAWSEGN